MSIKKWAIACLLVVFVTLSFHSGQAEAFSKGKPDPAAPPGTWYLGEDPPQKTGKPILFIHGLTGSASTWFEPNDMYKQAQQAGHPTAFINLHPDKSYWTNGALLAEKLAEMNQHFGEKVIIVGHSKGGVDAQAALIHYNAEQYVSNVVTLGTPHHGSQLANLAYSNWAGWLAEIIGMRSEGTDSLQTGTMANFRAQTDAKVTSRSVPFATLSGKSWGSFGSSLYFGGAYLQFYGTNDGAVTVTSSRLPYAPEIASLSLDHFDIAIGHRVFPHIRNQFTATAAQTETENLVNEVSNQIVRGGEFSETGEQRFFIEEGVSSSTVSLLTSTELTNTELVSPSGNIIPLSSVQPEHEESIFNGAVAHHFEMKQPESGEWTIKMKQAGKNAFLATIALEGGVSESIEPEQGNVLAQFDAVKIDLDETTYSVHADDQLIVVDEPLDSVSIHSSALKPNTSQTLTVDIAGKTSTGELFERTIIKHQYVDKNGVLYE